MKVNVKVLVTVKLKVKMKVNENRTMEDDKLTELNQKIAEIKKRILLTEGQKAAHAAECEKQNRINNETIMTLKREIKELSAKCGRLRNPLQCPVIIKEMPIGGGTVNDGIKKSATTIPAIMVGKVNYPIGAKNVDEAIFLTDLKITELRKQLDLVKHRFKCRRQYLDKLIEKHDELLMKAKAQEHNLGEKPPETEEEANNRKLICQLENEIHRTNVRWMEAEHICKKYKSIKASLLNDAERFEKSLRELETALSKQQLEINRLQKVHNEAIEMKEAAKIMLQREEQQSNYSQKARERQSLDFRKQVELRKMELELIGRKLFMENKTTLPHQDSVSSSTGDLNVNTIDAEEVETRELVDMVNRMEELFKSLMIVTGATTCQEVYERFASQKESAVRLSYLRNAAEQEKSKLEVMRETLSQELESSKFADFKDQEVNQEVIESIKAQISENEMLKEKNLEVTKKKSATIKFLRDHLIELIFRMQEVDETTIELENRNRLLEVTDLPPFLTNEADELDIINILKFKLDKCRQLSHRKDESISDDPFDFNISDEQLMEQSQLTKTPPLIANDEKPTLMPVCYQNLFTGRTQRAIGTSSSSPDHAPPISTTTVEEETEVPSRNFLKRQSAIIVDQKSRRKPFRPIANPRRK